MLIRQTYTYTPQLEPPILSTLPEPLAAQLVREMVRLKSREVLPAERVSAGHFVDNVARANGLLLRPRH